MKRVSPRNGRLCDGNNAGYIKAGGGWPMAGPQAAGLFSHRTMRLRALIEEICLVFTGESINDGGTSRAYLVLLDGFTRSVSSNVYTSGSPVIGPRRERVQVSRSLPTSIFVFGAVLPLLPVFLRRLRIIYTYFWTCLTSSRLWVLTTRTRVGSSLTV